jgi:hypothetical protein
VAILNGMSRCILSPSLLLAPTARTPSSALLALCASPFSFHSNFLLFIRPASPYTAWALAPILCPSPHMSTSSSLSFAPPPSFSPYRCRCSFSTTPPSRPGQNLSIAFILYYRHSNHSHINQQLRLPPVSVFAPPTSSSPIMLQCEWPGAFV